MSVKTMKPFEFHLPQTLDEALEILGKYGEDAKVIAGGTDVVPKLKARVFEPGHIVDISRIKELNYLNYDEETGLHVGAAVTLKNLEKSDIVKKVYPALYQGSSSIASTQIRNSGTLAGNVCNAVPSADSIPSLLALGAEVKIVSKNGERIVPLNEFFVGVCKTVVKPDEIVTGFHIPVPAKGSKSVYFSQTARRALDLAIVGVAVSGVVEDGVCKDIKIGLGAVAPTPKRAYEAEKMLIGQKLTEELIEQAAECAGYKDCSPITDMRATREYRQDMVRVHARNAIKTVAGLPCIL